MCVCVNVHVCMCVCVYVCVCDYKAETRLFKAAIDKGEGSAHNGACAYV